MQPGQTINPGDASDQASAQSVVQNPAPAAPVQEDVRPAQSPQTVQPLPREEPPASQESTSATPPVQTGVAQVFTNESQQDASVGRLDSTAFADTDLPVRTDIPTVSWSASEFIDHEKQASWFLSLAAVAVVVIALIFVMTRDFVVTIVVAIAAVLFGVTASRKPNILDYRLDSGGINIGPKHYDYGRFKSFSVIEEGAIDSIQLTPLARFAPPISLYYPPDQEDQVVGTLANYLPHEVRRHDPVDRFMRRIRF